MKKLRAIAFGALLTACCFSSRAQEQKIPLNEPDYNKPELFSDLPQKMNLKLGQLETVFNLSVGTKIRVQPTDQLLFEGTVVSVSDAQNASVKSIVIRSTNRQGATFTFTRTTNVDGSFTYLGRIMSPNNRDAFEVVREEGSYFLKKKNLYDILSE